MENSEAMFDIIASLLVSSEQPKQTSNLHGLDECVIALSMDSGLPLNDVRIRLKERMQFARESSTSTLASCSGNRHALMSSSRNLSTPA